MRHIHSAMRVWPIERHATTAKDREHDAIAVGATTCRPPLPYETPPASLAMSCRMPCSFVLALAFVLNWLPLAARLRDAPLISESPQRPAHRLPLTRRIVALIGTPMAAVTSPPSTVAIRHVTILPGFLPRTHQHHTPTPQLEVAFI
ncbi:hypothetical protein CKAH01_02114 [Colletotrichum kahawae]|uniref:Uncharacterized protein n=1 Tax=Colletotrichum kahawae TaxID=34407 RepID=A0AAD9Y0F8_COLKA|nr:hypothetical protein CKAH01_02114 [Colletotrichum kahawae]